MSGTKAGGLKAAATNKIKHGEDFYSRIGRKGGQNGHTGGFYANPELAKLAGAKGGRTSKRGPAKNKPAGIKKVSTHTSKKSETKIEEKKMQEQTRSIRLWWRLFGRNK